MFDIAAFAQARAQVDMIVLAKEHIDAAFYGQADAVARCAEIVAERRDQAERQRAVLHREIARGAAGPLVDRIDGARRAQRRDKLVKRDIMIAAVVRDLAEWNRLDQGAVAAGTGTIIEHREQLILVEPGARVHLDLDGQSRIARRPEPVPRDTKRPA